MIRIAISILLGFVFLSGCSTRNPAAMNDPGGECVTAVAYIVLLYREEHGILPTDMEAIVEFESQAPTVDPWGNKVHYDVVGESFTVRSAGPDRLLDTKDDPKAILSSPSTDQQ